MIKRILKTISFFLGVYFLVAIIYWIVYYLSDRSLDIKDSEVIIKFIFLIALILIYYFDFFSISKSIRKNRALDYKYILLFSTLFILLKSFYIVIIEQNNILQHTQHISWYSFLTFIILAPVVEELFNRYFLTNILIQDNRAISKIKEFLFVLLISFLFTIAHQNFQPEIIISHLGFSIGITYLYLKTRLLWLVIAVHAISNLLYQLNFHIMLSTRLSIEIILVLFFPILFLILLSYKKINLKL